MPVTFDAGESRDNVGIVSYEWNFGDGATGLGKTLHHMYEKPGEYAVRLTVKDAEGNLGIAYAIVQVSAAEEPASAQDVQLAIIGAVAAVLMVTTILIASRRKKSPEDQAIRIEGSPKQ